MVPVRQVKDLPTASFRFRLATDTLAVQLCASSLPTCTRDFHPLEPAHGGQTRKNPSHDGKGFSMRQRNVVFSPYYVVPSTSVPPAGADAAIDTLPLESQIT